MARRERVPVRQVAPLRAQQAFHLNEEKWLLEALKKVRKQRNCLQIEKLHLQSLKAALEDEGKKKQSSDQGNDDDISKQGELPQHSREIKANVESYQKMMVFSEDELDEPDSMNLKEIDLSIADNLANLMDAGEQFEEEDEESEESDVDNMDIALMMVQNNERSIGH